MQEEGRAKRSLQVLWRQYQLLYVTSSWNFGTNWFWGSESPPGWEGVERQISDGHAYGPGVN